MKKAPNVDGIMGRLLILKKIQPGEKLRINPDGSFSIDPAGYFQFLRRSVLVSKSSREDTYAGLKQLVEDVNQYSETLLDSKSLAVIEHRGHVNELELAAYNSKFKDITGLRDALQNSLPGLTHLMETYKETNIEVQIEMVHNSLSETCSLMNERIKKLNHRFQYVQIHDTNRARGPRHLNYMVETERGEKNAAFHGSASSASSFAPPSTSSSSASSSTCASASSISSGSVSSSVSNFLATRPSSPLPLPRRLPPSNSNYSHHQHQLHQQHHQQSINNNNSSSGSGSSTSSLPIQIPILKSNKE